jgi:hypothetical protein
MTHKSQDFLERIASAVDHVPFFLSVIPNSLQDGVATTDLEERMRARSFSPQHAHPGKE